jgi:hypothetical protein
MVLDQRPRVGLHHFLTKVLQTEDERRAYIEILRWGPDLSGFTCPYCGAAGRATRRADGVTLRCAGCRQNVSGMVGTLFERTRTELGDWFALMQTLVCQKAGISGVTVQEIFGLASYHTAWVMLHKLRRAMVAPIGGGLSGKVGIESHRLANVAGVPERSGGLPILILFEMTPPGRIRIALRGDEADERAFIDAALAPGVVLERDIDIVASRGEGGAPATGAVVKALDLWLFITHRGGVLAKHLPYYLDEFTFRYNRRQDETPDMLFTALLRQALAVGPVTYEDMVGERT